MDRGDYVPDSVTNAMVRDRLAEPDAAAGLPARRLPAHARPGRRARRDARRGRRRKLDRVVELTVDDDEVVAPAAARGPREQGRTDDTEDVIRRRLEIYAEETAPLAAALLRARAAPCRSTASATVDEVTAPAARRARRMTRPSRVPQTRERMIQIKTRDQVQLMRRAGIVVGETLELLREAVRPGVTTAELDAVAEAAHPQPWGDAVLPRLPRLPGHDLRLRQRRDRARHPGGPGAARGRPRLDRLRRDRRRLARRRGHHRPGRRRSPPSSTELMAVTEDALWTRLRRRPARRPAHRHRPRRRDSYVRQRGDYGIVEEYVGHGIGTEMHQEPNVPNYGRAGRGPELVEGLVLAVEPMVNLGSRHTRQLDDGWTVVTQDGRGRRTSSTRSPSPRTARGCSPRSTAAEPGSRPSGSAYQPSAEPLTCADAARQAGCHRESGSHRSGFPRGPR